MKPNSGPLQIVWKREDGDVILFTEYIGFADAWRVKLFKQRKNDTLVLTEASLEMALRCIAVSARATKTMEEIGHE